ncbi:hypothetical protein B0H14DRAFT_2598582 [Mycena olivaceomarginata]|nr:hypothetical protein B0H14DRAFT_2598582 [Mycena olivaceomarginata]
MLYTRGDNSPSPSAYMEGNLQNLPKENASGDSSENKHIASKANPLFLPSPSPSPSLINDDYFSPHNTPRYLDEAMSGSPGPFAGIQSTQVTKRVVSGRDVSTELRASIPRGHKHQKNRKQEPGRDSTIRSDVPPPIHGSRCRVVKRPYVAAPSRSALPAKPHVMPNVCRRATPIKLIQWTNDLIRLEEIVYQGRQGRGQLHQVVTLLNAMLAGEVTFAWVQEAVRTRATAVGEQRKDKAHLVQDIVRAYATLQQEGEIVKLGNALFNKWLVLT